MHRVWKHLKYPLKHPGIVPRAVSNYVRMTLLRQPRLRAVEFAINYDCQCRCDHCSAAFLRRDGAAPLSTAEICDAAEQMVRLGAMNLNFTGGEALLHPDLGAMIRAARPRSTVVSVATNGILLDRAMARSLARWGARVVTMSVDSADPDTHDRFRRSPGCWRKVMEATDHCREVGVDVFWCTVMTHENAGNGDLLRLVDLAAEREVMLTINKPCPVGRWQDRAPGLTDDDRRLHADLMRRPHVRWEGHSNYRKEGCPAGIEKLYVSPYGDVMPCPFIHIGYGNLHTERLDAIWRRMLTSSSFNTVRPGCPISEDPEFARNYLDPIHDGGEHPLPAARHPVEKDRP
jgi:MoaA/NifB/PqqE/SkfB family radical SAM enzyme